MNLSNYMPSVESGKHGNGMLATSYSSGQLGLK